MNFASRYSAGPRGTAPFPVLYLAEDQIVALFEVQALLGSPFGFHQPNPRQHWVTVPVTVSLHSVADLTDIANQTLLDASCQHITGDWNGYQLRATSRFLTAPTGLAPTQQLGAALHSVPGLEGFRTVSARVPDKMTLVLFPAKFQKASYVEFSNPQTGERSRIEAP